MPSAIASGLSGSTRTAASPEASSSEGCAGGDDGRAAGHRLEDRDSEALEEGRIREDGRAAIEIGQLLVGDVLGRDEPQLGEELHRRGEVRVSSSADRAGRA